MGTSHCPLGLACFFEDRARAGFAGVSKVPSVPRVTNEVLLFPAVEIILVELADVGDPADVPARPAVFHGIGFNNPQMRIVEADQRGVVAHHALACLPGRSGYQAVRKNVTTLRSVPGRQDCLPHIEGGSATLPRRAGARRSQVFFLPWLAGKRFEKGWGAGEGKHFPQKFFPSPAFPSFFERPPYQEAGASPKSGTGRTWPSRTADSWAIRPGTR